MGIYSSGVNFSKSTKLLLIIITLHRRGLEVKLTAVEASKTSTQQFARLNVMGYDVHNGLPW